MPVPARGDIYHIEIAQGEAMGHELEGGHWWVVLSPIALNAQIQLFTAVPLTSVHNKKTGKPKDDGDFRLFRIRVLATEKAKDPGRVDSVLEGDSVALTEQTRSFSSLRIKDEQRAGTVTAKALGAIEAGLQFIIGAGIIRRQDVPAAVRAGPVNMPKEPPKPLPGQPFHTHHK